MDTEPGPVVGITPFFELGTKFTSWTDQVEFGLPSKSTSKAQLSQETALVWLAIVMLGLLSSGHVTSNVKD